MNRNIKQTRATLFLGLVLMLSVLTSVSGFKLAGASQEPKAADPVTDLSVMVGDVIYYRTFDDNYEIESNGPLKQGTVLKMSVTGLAGDEITYDRHLYYPNGTFIDSDLNIVENYTTYQVMGHMFQLKTITNYMTASGTTVEDIDDAWRESINSTTEPINNIYDSSDDYYHYLHLEGAVDDNDTHVRMIDVWVSKAYNIVTVMNQTEPGREQYQELMGYDRVDETDDTRYLPAWEDLPTFESPSNFAIGDTTVVLRVPMNEEEDDEHRDATGASNEEDDDPLFVTHEVKFIYRNPNTVEDVVVVELNFYDNPALTSSIAPAQLYIEEGRTVISDPASVMGSMFFADGLVASLTDPIIEDMIGPMMEITSGITTVKTTDSFTVTGMTDDGLNAEFYVEVLNGYGFPQIQWRKYTNATYKEWILEITIDGPGVDVLDPMVGVSEGDTWTLLAQSEVDKDFWGPDADTPYQRKQVMNMKYTVTHILAINATVMGVFGKVEEWESSHPEYTHTNDFTPLLIFDTNDVASFLTQGGFAEKLEGPPMLLPKVQDWEEYGSEIEETLMDSGMIETSNIKSHYETDQIRLTWDDRENEDDYEERFNGQVLLGANEDGIVTHFEFQVYEYENNHTSNKGKKKQEQTTAFCFEMDPATGCHTNPASDVSNVVAGDELIWEHQQYGLDDTLTPEYRRERSKIKVELVVSACDGSTVFFGQRLYRDIADTEFSADYWQLEPEGEPAIDINFWMASSIRDDDLWSWMSGQIFDKEVTDFSSDVDTLAALLTFALELPPGEIITAADITAGMGQFVATVEDPDKGVDHFLKLAVNEEGILQDMLMGDVNRTTGEWVEWERTVLANGRGTCGEVFTDTLPMYNIVDLTVDGTADAPPLVPGYPLLFTVLFGMAGIVLAVKKKRK